MLVIINFDVEIDKNLRLKNQVRSETTKANRSLGFIKRNLYMCPSNVKSAAYYTLVRPQLEYVSIVWDPYLKKHKYEIEKIQRREPWFVSKNYSREEGSMTRLFNELNWPTLETRRKYLRLSMFSKILNNTVEVEIPSYVKELCRQTRSATNNAKILIDKSILVSKDFYKFPFLPRTITDWNHFQDM